MNYILEEKQSRDGYYKVKLVQDNGVIGPVVAYCKTKEYADLVYSALILKLTKPLTG